MGQLQEVKKLSEVLSEVNTNSNFLELAPKRSYKQVS